MEDDSSDECSVDEWILYKNRPEWNDVQPVSQDDGPYPVVAIAYSEQYKDVYDFFRGVVAKNEKSERVLTLCRDALLLNPANYTVWQYRRLVLQELNSDLKKELDYVADVIKNHPKNYQVWHHRRIVVEWCGDGRGELKFTEKMLTEDPKNYHAWQHRQWVLTKYECFDEELEYIGNMLTKDVRNNSAWNQRYFVLKSSESGFSSDVINTEVDFIIKKLENCINNESVWNYLRGILLHCDSNEIKLKIINFCNDLYEKDSHGEYSVHLFAFLADNAVEAVENGSGNQKERIKYAVKLYRDLALKYDVIRTSYWNFILEELRQRYEFTEEV